MDDDSYKDDNDDKGISALGLDRDMGFSQGHQGQNRADSSNLKKS